MSSGTIDVGIDLGTTNSAVAVLRGVHTEVIKNNDGDETTPSAVWIDRRNRLYVGRAARDRSERDPDNTCIEFKLRMGTAGQDKRFPASGRTLTPEQLSAEVLASLRADVAARLEQEVRAAVITVPAAFGLGPCEATQRAAELAGLTFTRLLQEPAAAAHAYGFQATEENAMWLVYDFGGGTFDAAVIRLRDGEFSVVGHCGDNYLGGKLIDWRIVEELLIPEAVRQVPELAGLARGNPRWLGAVAALKQAAETAKIRLSRAPTADILVELADDTGRRFEFDHELSRADVEALAEPLVARSINLCRTALEEFGVGPADIEKTIMVGGQTAMPFLRERLADPARGLGIPLDFGHDPMTVVARGAAVFAGAQPLPADWSAPAPRAGAFSLRAEYPRVSPDLDPVVVGRVTGTEGAPTEGLAVELVNEESDPPWRSGRVPVSERGDFTSVLRAEPGRRNVFRVHVTDASGTRWPVTPDHLGYTVGAVETEPMLTHAIGVALADNQVRGLVERGARLPVRRTTPLRTTVTVDRGHGGGLIRIPVLEGERPRADRNRTIGSIEVGADRVSRAVPAGSEVRLTVEIDASRLVKVSAFVPLLDEVFETTVSLLSEPVVDTRELEMDAGAERARLAQLAERGRDVDSPVADLLLQRVVDEDLDGELDRAVDAARQDPSESGRANSRLLDLRLALDAVEDELAWPELVRQAEAVVTEVRDLIAAHGSESDKADLPLYERDIQRAIESRDADLLRQRTDRLREHAMRVLDRSGVLQPLVFDNLAAHQSSMRYPERAARLIAEGRRARDTGEEERLRSINIELQSLLPEAPPSILGGDSTVL
ncbi:Hsp70 family protein [Streptomyces radicis]|uniref:Hsp70 family protein n=1 Tax=Streptomyces radicis TaxID=1750517 RepID=A0A3A9W2A5_9ACTN|nr:Hsp70 family protein [Streptomyces radicis]RKN06882.1 Hsp70 family protein [Streptomyces radicis]RKN19500.1 Hsp70 family protein [Streptomyces radicis]